MSINNNIGEYNILRHLYTYHVLLCLDTLYIQVLKTY